MRGFSLSERQNVQNRTGGEEAIGVVMVGVRPGAIPTPESESNDDSDFDSGVGIICSSFWWSRNRSRNRGDWNRSRNRGDWNRSWNRNQMTIPHIYVHGTT